MCEEVVNYKISNHAMIRYSERIMDKDNKNDVNRFIVENKEKIHIDINKMIEYGELIFTGKQSQKDGKGNVLNVYLKDLWIILVDNKTDVVVTLYKVDLGLDEELNHMYVSKIMDKLNIYKKELEDVQLKVFSESNMYRDMINETEAQINEYKSMIKNLEELCSGYNTIIENNYVKVSQANKNVVDIVNTLIGKKEF